MISKKDKEVVHRLAADVAEIAASPVQEKKELFRLLDDSVKQAARFCHSCRGKYTSAEPCCQ